MILLSYIILGHPDWKKGFIKIFSLCKEDEKKETRENIIELIHQGRLPISLHNIEIIGTDQDVNSRNLINEKSSEAGLTLIGFRGEMVKQLGEKVFQGYDQVDDIIFVNANKYKEIK